MGISSGTGHPQLGIAIGNVVAIGMVPVTGIVVVTGTLVVIGTFANTGTCAWSGMFGTSVVPSGNRGANGTLG